MHRFETLTGHANLRSYPIQFGMLLQKLLPDFMSSSRSIPAFTDEVRANLDSKAIFKSMSMADQWPDADICSLIRYLRGNRHLNIPEDWLEVIPKEL